MRQAFFEVEVWCVSDFLEWRSGASRIFGVGVLPVVPPVASGGLVLRHSVRKISGTNDDFLGGQVLRKALFSFHALGTPHFFHHERRFFWGRLLRKAVFSLHALGTPHFFRHEKRFFVSRVLRKALF